MFRFELFTTDIASHRGLRRMHGIDVLRQDVLVLERDTTNLAFDPLAHFVLVLFLVPIEREFTLEHTRAVRAHVRGTFVNDPPVTLQGASTEWLITNITGNILGGMLPLHVRF